MTKSGQNEKNSLKRIVTPKTTPPTTARLSPRFPRQSLAEIINENWIELNQWYFNLVGLWILILNGIERFFLWTWLVWGSNYHWLGCRSPPCPSPVLWKSMNMIQDFWSIFKLWNWKVLFKKKMAHRKYCCHISPSYCAKVYTPQNPGCWVFNVHFLQKRTRIRVLGLGSLKEKREPGTESTITYWCSWYLNLFPCLLDNHSFNK